MLICIYNAIWTKELICFIDFNCRLNNIRSSSSFKQIYCLEYKELKVKQCQLTSKIAFCTRIVSSTLSKMDRRKKCPCSSLQTFSTCVFMLFTMIFLSLTEPDQTQFMATLVPSLVCRRLGMCSLRLSIISWNEISQITDCLYSINNKQSTLLRKHL